MKFPTNYSITNHKWISNQMSASKSLYTHNTYTNIWHKYIVNNDELIHFFIKISHTLFLKGLMLVVCERRVGDGLTATFWPKVLLTIVALLSRPGWAAQPWVTEGPKPLSAAGSQFGILSPKWLQQKLELTQAVCVLVIFLFDSHLLPLIYTGASLDWRLGRGSICNKMTDVNLILLHSNTWNH